MNHSPHDCADHGPDAPGDEGEGGTHRIIIRLGLIVVWTLFMVCIRLLVWPATWVAPRFERACRRHLVMFWARCTVGMLGFRVTIIGPRPARPFLLVSNHQSYVDSVLYAKELGCIFIAMAEIRGWPLIGPIVACCGNEFITRQRARDALRVHGIIERLIEHGEGVMIYPEANTSDGTGVLPFKPALLEPAATNGWPVYSATIQHKTPDGWPPASEAVCWVGEVSFIAQTFRTLRLPWVETTITFNGQPLRGTDRKNLAAALHDAVLANLRCAKQEDTCHDE